MAKKKNISLSEGVGKRSLKDGGEVLARVSSGKKYAELLCDFMFKRLFLLAEIDKFTAAEKKQYLKSLENMGDYRNMINSAAEEAEKRGHAAGLAEAARRMLAARMSLKSVSEILQVPESELQKQL